jgi:alpha-tubulin suppressor-like RCC1 family protein
MGSARAVDIAPMNWTPRPDWINVKSPGIYTQETGTPNAVGDGVTDDTTAIQGVLNWVSNVSGLGPEGRHPTVYFPPGTYKISSTLLIKGNTSPCNLIGSGINTTIKWYGASGGAMVWPNGSSGCRYVGFVWDGNNIASCAFLEYSNNGPGGSSNYMTAIRHENESFRNFNVNGTYPLPDPAGIYPNGFPPAAIISGFDNPNGASPVGEVTILNCRFSNCTNAIFNPVEIFNNFMWVVDGCEFDNNGTGFTGTQTAGGGSDFVLLNSHFQGSTVADIGLGWGMRGQRLTSSGSAQFFNGLVSGMALQDCWVDSWTNPSAAMVINGSGVGSVVDCTFTNPPSGAAPPINTSGIPMLLMLSNNIAPAFPSPVGLQPGEGLLQESYGSPTIEWIPPGSMGGNVASANQTFLKSTYPADTTNVIDVTAAPYNADLTGVNDSTTGIQAAINAASSANNGSCVYIPCGIYKISSTLSATGGNYIIEGEGGLSQLCWYGGSNGTMMTVSSPQNVTIRNIHLSALDDLPASDPTTVVGIKETSTGPSSIVYDGVGCDAFGLGNIWATGGNATGPGLVLSGLPSGSTVYIPALNSPLTVKDCGQAQIFSLKANIQAVNVSGATNPKTGFLGLMVAEGGILGGRSATSNSSLYNFTVSDDQNLLVGPYYSEQCYNDLDLQLGAGTTPGHVSIQGLLSAPTPQSVSIKINDYMGRLFYAQQTFSGGVSNPGVQVTQSGSNPIDVVLAEDFFDGPEPNFTLDTGANLIAALPQYGGVSGFPTVLMADNPDPLTSASLASIAQGLDDFRQLGALNLAVEYGQINTSGLVAYWKLDEPVGPSADSSMSGTTGTWENAPTFITDHPATIPYADSGSLLVNGDYQYVNMGTPSGLPSGTAPRTICGWGKSNSTAAGYRWIASFGSPGGGQAMFIGMNGTTLDGGAYGDDLNVPNFWDNNWHFIALTYDGATASLYADGKLVASSPRSWNLVPYRCYIGEQVNNDAEFWNGEIDDVRIYNYALSPAEISTLAGTSSLVGQLITGVNATSTSGNAEGNPGFTASNNSVVAGPSGVLGASDSMGDSGFNQDASDFGNFVTNLSGANITYDLGADYNVTNLLIWNFSQDGFANAGANSVTILSSTDNTNFTTVGNYTFNEVMENPGYGSARAIAGNNPPYALGYPGCDNVPAQVIPVFIPHARYIKLVINSNWGFTGGLVGLNEVNFIGTTGPPVFDLAKDFNTSADSASNTWAYGTYSDPSTPSTFNVPSSAVYSTILNGVGLWGFPPPVPDEQSDPNIEKNLTSSPIVAYGIDWLPGQVSFGPYQGPSVARFTAPGTGLYNIKAVFQTNQQRNTNNDGTTAYINVGNTNVYTQNLDDPGTAQFGAAQSYSSSNVSLNAGETVDFVVGGGAFTTQVGATITEIIPPSLNLPSGNYSSSQTLTITASSGEQLYYTTDGSAPTSSSTLYTGPISVTSTETVNVQAYLNGNPIGSVVSATYNFTPVVVASPVVSITGGSYPAPFNVTVSCATSGATIYYTTDGTIPTSSSSTVANNGTITIGQSETLSVNALVSGSNPSATVTEAYQLTGQVVGGNYHTLALRTNGTVWVAGLNTSNQLGDGTTTQKNSFEQLTGLSGMTQVTAAWYDSYALKNDGTLWGWGGNFSGELATGNASAQSTPVAISGLTGRVTQVSAGAYHVLALKSDGTVWAWGSNSNGQLGNGTTTDSHTPVQVTGLSNIVAIAAGAYHSLAIKADGSVWGWGFNTNGQVGDGTTTQRLTPVELSGWGAGSGATAVFANDYGSLLQKSDGTVWAWGTLDYGSNGATTADQQSAPVQVTGLSDVVALATGSYQDVAAEADGTVWTWGAAPAGALGTGTLAASSTPAQVSGVSDAIAVGAGLSQTYITEYDGACGCAEPISTANRAAD